MPLSVPPGWENVRNILAIRLDNIGDVIMTGPALRALKRALPEASITMLVSPAGSQIAGCLPWVDDVIVYRAVWQDASWSMAFDPARERNVIKVIRGCRFDAAVIFTSFSQSPYPPAYVTYLAGIPLRLGQSQEFGGSVLSTWVKPLPDATHQVDRNLHLLESAGFAPAERQLELAIADATRLEVNKLLQEINLKPGNPFIALAPGASCAARRYDPAYFGIAARQIVAETGLPVVVLGNQKEAEMIEPILAATYGFPVYSLVGRTTVPQLAEIIRRSSLLLANDSGPMHMADAFERPMVIMFSGTELEEQWQPRFALTRLLRRETHCAPCYNFRCPFQMECLDIPPAEVAAEVTGLLKIASPTTTVAA